MNPVQIYAVIIRVLFRRIERIYAACGHNPPPVPTEWGGDAL